MSIQSAWIHVLLTIFAETVSLLHFCKKKNKLIPAYALNFTNRQLGSLFGLPRVPIWVPISSKCGSLFLCSQVLISFTNSEWGFLCEGLLPGSWCQLRCWGGVTQVKDVRVPENLQRAMAAEAEAARNARAKVVNLMMMMMMMMLMMMTLMTMMLAMMRGRRWSMVNYGRVHWCWFIMMVTKTKLTQRWSQQRGKTNNDNDNCVMIFESKWWWILSPKVIAAEGEHKASRALRQANKKADNMITMIMIMTRQTKKLLHWMMTIIMIITSSTEW